MPQRALTAGVLATLVAAGAAVARAQPADTTRVYRYLMGTSIEVEAAGGTEAERRAAVDEAFASFAEVDRLMSNYRDDSELAAVNRDAATRAVPVSDALFAVLAAGQRVSRASGGAFDVTVGPLVRLWGFHDKQPHLPTAAERSGVAPLVNYRNLVLDEARHTVRFARPGVELDLGGIAKGFAVELAAGVLRRHGLRGFIDAGGNQYLLGLPAGKTAWSVGIKDPDAPDKILGVITCGEGSVATSSDDSNFLVADGQRYGHILDPRKLAPSDAALSVTVVGPDATIGDALTKAIFVLGPRDGLALVDGFPGMSALVVSRRADGRVAIAMSDALKGRFQPAVRAPLE